MLNYDPKRKHFKYPRQPSHSALVKINKFVGQHSVSIQNNNKATYFVNNTISETIRACHQCWGCQELSQYRNFHLKKKWAIHNTHEVTMVNDIARSIHKINASLENRQADHQYFMVEIEGMLNRKPIFI